MADGHETGEKSAAGTADRESPEAGELPAEVVDEAERLTRLARDAIDEQEARAYREARRDLLADHDFTVRIREDEHAVLVIHPEEWVEDGTVYPERIDDIDRGIERPLSGPGDPDDWEQIREQNDALAAEIEAEYGPTHGANVQLLADFMSNHYAKPIEQATEAELAEFRSEYYRRNAWPTDDQKAVVEESIELVRRVTARQR